MNLPTIIVLLIVAASLFAALWLNHRSGRKLSDCGCGSSHTPRCNATCHCQGCALADRCNGRKQA